MYIKLNNGNIEKYPYSIDEFKIDNKDTSFPEVIPDSLFAEYGVYSVIPTPQPQVDYRKNVIEEQPNLIDGKWYQDWSVTDKPIDEANAIAEQLRAEAYRNESDPLFFKAQRGEIEQQVWLDKVAEIKARYPKG